MAVIRRRFELIADVASANILNADDLRPATESTTNRLFRGDTCVLCFRLRSYNDPPANSDDYDAFPVNAGTVLTFGIKDPDDLSGNYLVEADNDQMNISGDWDEALRSGGLISVRLAVSSAELDTFLGTSAREKVRCELEAQDPGEEPTTLFQYDCYIYGDVNRGTEGATASANPAFATIPYVDNAVNQGIAPSGGSVRIYNGQLQLWNTTQSKWHPIWIEGADGEEHITIGPAES